MPSLYTPRLILRQWQNSDRDAFAGLTASARVMQYFPATLSRAQSDQSIDSFSASIDTNGWGFWACESRATGEFAGFIGLNAPGYELPFSPCVEVGWRLAERFWGNGLATEGALASLHYAFNELGLDEVISMTPVTNLASIAVMKKIGMSNTNSNFMHPRIADKHALQEHVLYKINQAAWPTVDDPEGFYELV